MTIKRIIHIGAGHGNQPGADMGAPPPKYNIGYTEGIETVHFRDLLFQKLETLGHCPVLDANENLGGETIAEFKKLLQHQDMAVSIHYNSFPDKNVSGTEVLVSKNATELEIRIAGEISLRISQILRINNRGVKSETQSARGRLGWFRLPCEIKLLIELCFITSPKDMKSIKDKEPVVAQAIAEILNKYSRI